MAGSRSGPSLADWMVMPETTVRPMAGETTKPEGGAGSPLLSKFKYLVVLLSITFATPSEPGLLEEDAITGSPGCVTSGGSKPPSNSTSATCIQQVFTAAVFVTTQR